MWSIAIALLLIGLSGFVIHAKQAGWAWSEEIDRLTSLQGEHVLGGIDDVLLVPMAALIVVLVRLTLGIRMLGPFRPILIAIGLGGAGLWLGLGLFLAVTALMLALRPGLSRHGFPYFSRLMILLVAVVAVELLALVAGRIWEIESLTRAVYFPMVVLCLASDGFARVLREEGRPSALWRGSTTIVTAVVIHLVGGIGVLERWHIDYPELVFAYIGCIILVTRLLNFRLFESWNVQPLPPPETPQENGLG